MNPQPDEAAQLLAAGERDRTGFRILNRDAEASDAIVLFHAQQAVEKFIKSALASRGVVYRRTHDLLELSSLATQNGLAIPADPALLARLGPYAVEFRYMCILAPTVSRVEAEALIDRLLEWAKQELTACHARP